MNFRVLTITGLLLASTASLFAYNQQEAISNLRSIMGGHFQALDAGEATESDFRKIDNALNSTQLSSEEKKDIVHYLSNNVYVDGGAAGDYLLKMISQFEKKAKADAQAPVDEESEDEFFDAEDTLPEGQAEQFEDAEACVDCAPANLQRNDSMGSNDSGLSGESFHTSRKVHVNKAPKNDLEAGLTHPLNHLFAKSPKGDLEDGLAQPLNDMFQEEPTHVKPKFTPSGRPTAYTEERLKMALTFDLARVYRGDMAKQKKILSEIMDSLPQGDPEARRLALEEQVHNVENQKPQSSSTLTPSQATQSPSASLPRSPSTHNFQPITPEGSRAPGNSEAKLLQVINFELARLYPKNASKQKERFSAIKNSLPQGNDDARRAALEGEVKALSAQNPIHVSEKEIEQLKNQIRTKLIQIHGRNDFQDEFERIEDANPAAGGSLADEISSGDANLPAVRDYYASELKKLEGQSPVQRPVVQEEDDRPEPSPTRSQKFADTMNSSDDSGYSSQSSSPSSSRRSSIDSGRGSPSSPLIKSPVALDIKIKSATGKKPVITQPKGNQNTKELATNITETLDLEKSALRRLKVEVAKLKAAGTAIKYVSTINQLLTQFQSSLNLKTSGTGTTERVKLYAGLSRAIEDHFPGSDALSAALLELKAHLDGESTHRTQRALLIGGAEVGGAKVTKKPMPVVSTKGAALKKSAAAKGSVEQISKADLAEIGQLHSQIAKQLRALRVQVNGLGSIAFTPAMSKDKLGKMIDALITTYDDDAILDHEMKPINLKKTSLAVEGVASKASTKAKNKILQTLSKLKGSLEREEAMFKDMRSNSPELQLTYDKESRSVTQQ